MKALMKYEFRKTRAVKLILLGVTAAAEILYLAGLYIPKGNNLLSTAVLLLVLLAFGGVMLIGVTSVAALHQDMNTRQGYMLFMTPNSCYRILGAKVLENGLSMLTAGGFFFGLGALDITLLFAKEGNLRQLWEWVEQMIRAMNEEVPMNAGGLACLCWGLLSAWFSMVMTAFLADVVSAALLNGKKFNGLISFLLFLAISFLVSWAARRLTGGVSDVNTYFLVRGGVLLVFSALMFLGTAEIMQRKLSV